jgi:Regulator of ribonuclease activity B
LTRPQGVRAVRLRCDNRVVSGRILFCLLSAWSLLATAAPHGVATSRADLQRWLIELRASGAVDVTAPLPWEYVFSDGDERKLEALSLALVGNGYGIATLRGGELRVVKTELHNAVSLARRNRELEAMARMHGVASYDGVDLAVRQR